MKKAAVISIILVLFGMNMQAQRFNQDQQTLFGNKTGFGGFIGLNTKIGDINNQDALFIGGEAKFALNHSFNIGVEGYGMANNVLSNSYNDDGERNHLEMGYGGLSLEPVIWSESVIHFTIPVLAGAGGISEHSIDAFNLEDFDDEVWENKPFRSDFFLFVEPGVNAEVNIFKMLRLAGGVSYRFVSDVQIPGLDRNALEGYNVNVSLRFGWF